MTMATAKLTTWLNSEVPPAQVAPWTGNSGSLYPARMRPTSQVSP
jgi:hypothetical protein